MTVECVCMPLDAMILVCACVLRVRSTVYLFFFLLQCAFYCIFYVQGFCVCEYVFIFPRPPQHQCVQGVTPCQHSKSLTILCYPQVKQAWKETKTTK